MINADKPHLWKADVAKSVDQYNLWFMDFAPATYRETRITATQVVIEAFLKVNDLRDLNPEALARHPEILQILRMATAPPVARDRLVGLAYTTKPIVQTMEKGQLPPRLGAAALRPNLERMCAVFEKLIDRDLFPWLADSRDPTDEERARAATIVADRLCGSQSDPIIRNAQERRQLETIERFLLGRGYRKQAHPATQPVTEMERGTFAFRMVVVVGTKLRVNIPIDVVIQPHRPREGGVPILVEAKSAGDFTNPNKRRKEEATKIAQLKVTLGYPAQLILFLCGYFDSGYLGYEAAEGLDWIWEHRIEDMLQLGLDR